MQGPETFNDFMVRVNRKIRVSGKFNFESCRIPVPSNFNFEFLEKNLQGFTEFPLIIDCLKYGFPLDIQKGYGSHEIPRNHRGATDFPKQMEKILHKEIITKSAIGPFVECPFEDACFSPLNSVS